MYIYMIFFYYRLRTEKTENILKYKYFVRFFCKLLWGILPLKPPQTPSNTLQTPSNAHDIIQVPFQWFLRVFC